MNKQPKLTRFVGGPCDGLATSNKYAGRNMVFYRGKSAFHLYERITKHSFEHWGIFPHEENPPESGDGFLDFGEF